MMTADPFLDPPRARRPPGCLLALAAAVLAVGLCLYFALGAALGLAGA